MYRDDYDAALERLNALSEELARVVAERDQLATENSRLKDPASEHRLATAIRERDELAEQIAGLHRAAAKGPSMTICPKCAGAMQRGFPLDETHGGQSAVGQWARGEPQKSFWVGVKHPDMTIPIATFRCAKCGYLEHYARPEFRKK